MRNAAAIRKGDTMNEGTEGVSPANDTANVSSLLARIVSFEEIGIGLARERTSASTALLAHFATTSDHSSLQTDLAQKRTGLSQRRTALADDRNHLAATRTVLSRMRTELARGRTALALIRTGLAFLTLGVGLFRFFGPSPWSVFDAALVIGSLVVTTVGARSYVKVMRATAKLQETLDAGA